MENEASAPAAEEPPRPLFRLKLDHDDIYWGCEAIAERDAVSLGERDVVLDHAPDNQPGLYRWIRAKKVTIQPIGLEAYEIENPGFFEVLPKERQKAEPSAPTLEQAFYELAIAVSQSGVLKEYNAARGARLVAWLAAFEKTIDEFRGQ